MAQRQLTKSRDNKMISGVIAGICEYFGWSRDVVTILRILFVVLAFSSWGGLIVLYFVASWIIPSGRENRERDAQGNFQGSYQEKWERKADKWSEKFDEKSEKWADKFDQKARKYEDKFNQGSWNYTKSDAWKNSPWYDEMNRENGRKIKEAEPIIEEKKKEKEDDWSDF